MNKETGHEAKMNGREALSRLVQGLWSNFISLSSLILHSTPAKMIKKTGIGKLRRVFKRDSRFYIFYFSWADFVYN
jgi:hypothetical protein